MSEDFTDIDEQLRLDAEMRPQIQLVRGEIFRLARQAPDVETMHWYMWLDEAFENNEFDPEGFSTLQWRSFVLQSKGEPVGVLLSLITRVLLAYGLVDDSGHETKRQQQ